LKQKIDEVSQEKNGPKANEKAARTVQLMRITDQSGRAGRSTSYATAIPNQLIERARTLARTLSRQCAWNRRK
jgi:hypothetical protein